MRRDGDNEQKAKTRDVKKSKPGNNGTKNDDSIVQNQHFPQLVVQMRENKNYSASYFTALLKNTFLLNSVKIEISSNNTMFLLTFGSTFAALPTVFGSVFHHFV